MCLCVGVNYVLIDLNLLYIDTRKKTCLQNNEVEVLYNI